MNTLQKSTNFPSQQMKKEKIKKRIKNKNKDKMKTRKRKDYKQKNANKKKNIILKAQVCLLEERRQTERKAFLLYKQM